MTSLLFIAGMFLLGLWLISGGRKGLAARKQNTAPNPAPAAETTIRARAYRRTTTIESAARRTLK
jgi:hypothetical protein